MDDQILTADSDLGFAVVDHGRKARVGHPEVIYCAGKTPEQVVQIVKVLREREHTVLATRAESLIYDAVVAEFPEAVYNAVGKTIVIRHTDESESGMESETEAETETNRGEIVIVCAGTSDLPVVEEAYETVRALGFSAQKVVDVGVAGIHRLFERLDVIRQARVVIVVAGMEGALASVIGGLVDTPVIAVPTSVGYGAAFGGLTALLTMLNSCAAGVTVVNIDNGFGAAYAAVQMLRIR